MRRRRLVFVVGLSAILVSGGINAGDEPSAPSRPPSRANLPPRKVVIGTVIFGPYGKYAGLQERTKELSDFVDAMAKEAMKKYPGRRLDLAIMPETTVTSSEGLASRRAVTWQARSRKPLSPWHVVTTPTWSSRSISPRSKLRDSCTQTPPCWLTDRVR